MSLAQTRDDEALTKYQLSIRTTVPINSIASIKTAEPNSRLRRTLGRLCTFHNSKFGGDTKLCTEIFIAKDPTDAVAEGTTTVAAASVNNHRKEPLTIEFTNGTVIHSTPNRNNNNNKRNSVDYYV